MPITDTFARQVKHSGAPAGDKHTDGDGMYLLVKASGKYWRLNYRFAGKQKTLALGVYPEVSLAEARKRRAAARTRLAGGDDPSTEKQAARRAQVSAAANTFEIVGREWLAKTSAKRGTKTQSRVVSWFERDVFPIIGGRIISELGQADILPVFERIEARGAIDSAHRVFGYVHGVFALAAAKQLIERDPMFGLKEALAAKGPEGHFAAITEPVKFGQLLRAIAGYEGHPTCVAALQVSPYIFVRPVELRMWEWTELDFDRAEWIIPGVKMKMEIDHIVPLTDQVLKILREQFKITGYGKYVFPTIGKASRPMSDGTINAALRALGYPGDVHVGHGFRATARTIMDEVLKERVDLIEHQLAHQVKDVNGRAYNRTTHLAERREMMQRWADYLDQLRRGAVVVPIRA